MNPLVIFTGVFGFYVASIIAMWILTNWGTLP